MSVGFEQYGQCSGHWYESSAISVLGLGGCIDHQSLLRHRLDEPSHVVAEIGAVVALAERADDGVERAFPVAQLEDLRRCAIEPHDALGDQQLVLLADLVVLQPCARGEPGASHASWAGEIESCVSPCAIASSCAHSTSVLKRSAATAASWCSRVRQRSTVRSSAYCASRGACTSRARKYSSPDGSIQS